MDYLDNIDLSKVCGYYVNLIIVRAGKQAKVALQLWELYVRYVETLLKHCPNLQLYVVSAGGFTSKEVRSLLE